MRIKDYVSMIESNLFPMASSNNNNQLYKNNLIVDDELIASLNKLNADIKEFIRASKNHFTQLKLSNETILDLNLYCKSTINELFQQITSCSSANNRVNKMFGNNLNKERTIKNKLNQLTNKIEKIIEIKYEIGKQVKYVEKEIVKLFENTKFFYANLKFPKYLPKINKKSKNKQNFNTNNNFGLNLLQLNEEILNTKSNLNHSFSYNHIFTTNNNNNNGNNEKIVQLEKKNEMLENEIEKMKKNLEKEKMLKKCSSCENIKRISIKELTNNSSNDSRINEIITLKNKLTKINDDLVSIQKEKENLNKNILGKDEQITKLNQQIENLKKEKDEMNKIINDKMNINDYTIQLKEDNSKINREFEKLKKDYENAKEDYINEKTEKEKIILNSKSMASSLKDTLKQISLLKKEKLESDNAIKNLEEEMKQKIETISQKKDNEISIINKEKEKISKEKDDALKQVDQLIRELNIARNSIM